MSRYGGIVLAGGKSARMGTGRDKAVELLGGKKLLEWAIELLSAFTDKILVVGRGTEEISGIDSNVQSKAIDFVEDIEEDKGPLVGIYTGLIASSHESNFVIACDMPFLTKEILQLLTESDVEQDAVVLTTGGRIQPLVAIYGKRCIQPLKACIDKGDLAVHRFLRSISAVYVETRDERAVADIDSIDDLEDARRRLGQQ